MVEYLRRAALWVEALGITEGWPFLDVTAPAAPRVRAPDAVLGRLDAISVHIAWPPVRTVVEAALHWAAVRDAGVAVPDLPDPDEPLLLECPPSRGPLPVGPSAVTTRPDGTRLGLPVDDHHGDRERGPVLTETFRRDGDEVRWTRRGTGPAVVFCHGTPWSAALWEPIADALSADFTVHLWDMPGYGTSTKAEGQDVSLARQAELLAELLAHWDLDTPHLVGHDYGGVVALRAHLLHGARYRSLALVDVVALSPWGTDFLRLVRDHTDVFTRIPPALHEALVRAYVRGAAARPLAPEAEEVLVRPWLGPEGQAALYRQMAQADERYTDEVEPRYPELDLPVTVVWGAEDAWLPVEQGHRLAALIPGAQLHVVPGAGHLIQLDAPAALTAILQRWLLQQVSGTRPPRGPGSA